MIILPRVYTPINFQSHKYSSSLLLFYWTSILELSLPDIFRFLSSFNPKGYCYPYAWSCPLCEGDCFFCTGLIFRKLLEFLFVFFLDWLYLIWCLTTFSSLNHHLHLRLCLLFVSMLFYLI